MNKAQRSQSIVCRASQLTRPRHKGCPCALNPIYLIVYLIYPLPTSNLCDVYWLYLNVRVISPPLLYIAHIGGHQTSFQTLRKDLFFDELFSSLYFSFSQSKGTVGPTKKVVLQELIFIGNFYLLQEVQSIKNCTF